MFYGVKKKNAEPEEYLRGSNQESWLAAYLLRDDFRSSNLRTSPELPKQAYLLKFLNFRIFTRSLYDKSG